MNYEFNKNLIQSESMKTIFKIVEKYELQQFKNISFIIVGQSGTGKSTFADYLQKSFYKNLQMVIQKNITSLNDIVIGQACIYTVDARHWNSSLEEALVELKKQGEFELIQMPSLNERVADLVPLAHFMIEVLSLMNGKPQLKLSEKSIEVLSQYKWPGQFHEFETVIESAYLQAVKYQAKEWIEPEHLHFKAMPLTVDFSVGAKLEEIERKYILQTLYFVHQNRTKAAEILGISIRTLRNKINQYRQEGFL